MRKLTEDECLAAIEKGDFEAPAEGAAAVILTQSWCPQWQAVKSYLGKAEDAAKEAGAALCINYIEYDLAPFFEKLMNFKEERFGNREIPYIRYYLDGKLAAESNYVSLEGFLHRLKIAKD
jgi:hypothetical protein